MNTKQKQLIAKSVPILERMESNCRSIEKIVDRQVKEFNLNFRHENNR